MKIVKSLPVLLSVIGLSFGTAVLAQTEECPVPSAESEILDSFDWTVAGGVTPAPMPGAVAFNSGGEAPPSPVTFMAHMPGHHGPGAPGCGDMMFCGLSGDLSLSDDQLERIFRIKQDFLDKVSSKYADLFVQHRALKDLLTQIETDKSKLLAVQTRINTLKGDIANSRLEEQMGVLGVLSAEQRKEIRRNFVKRADFGPGMMMHFKHCKRHNHPKDHE